MVSARNKMVLWARSGGRCQYLGCNKSLIGDLISGSDTLNAAYIAHIIGREPDGPRGDLVRSPVLVDNITNLMLLCDPHHRLIDREDVANHPEERLIAMKLDHERRLETVTAIEPQRASHVVLYGARIGQHDYPVRFDLAKEAMLPERYPAEQRAIHLDLSGVALSDDDPTYWHLQGDNLRRQFRSKLNDGLARGEITHISLFALAPQPLLIILGHLLSDIPAVAVHQLHREPQGWRWRDERAPIDINAAYNGRDGSTVALKFNVSATITDARVEAVLGPTAPVWTISTPTPHNDVMHRESDLAAFRVCVRQTLDRIKAHHGENATIHIFPALPVSAAVELGRIWMPKADLPLVIYDHNRTAGGFVARMAIPGATAIESSDMTTRISTHA